MRVLISLLIALAALAAEPASAKPKVREHRLTAAEIRDLAQRELMWCDGYEEAGDDCNAVTLLRLADDGRIIETTSLLISAQPRLQVVFGDVDELKGNSICSVMKVADMPIVFTLEGKPVPALVSAQLRAQIAQSFEDLDGKTICQTFYRGADKDRLREEVTVDGERREDLESNYVLREGADGFALRPQAGADEDDTSRREL